MKKMRADDDFALFFKLVKSLQENIGINPPALPRKRKALW